ncbi:hypothetical protein GXP71_17195 [Cellulomonas sp. H30R-01]|uniref:hypothetical protein n=1 Tax=Cellulomonas sp. H30R-01 TaxID=2704467 RepID=UPI00138CF403|nr:hypothetical protein [Cellulomonas sp. H30R-01]QHT57637.1 hypothetical protein GXP71_17195 [Cellulomonas sp. H30R-01]
MDARARATTVVPIFAGTTLLLLSIIFNDLAVVMILAAIVLFGLAAGSAIYQNKSSRSRKGFLVATAFVVAFAVGVGITLQAANAVSTAGVPTALNLTESKKPTITTAVSKTEVTVGSPEQIAASKRAATTIEQVQDDQVVVTGAREAKFIKAAQTSGYVPKSGLAQNFDEATVTTVGNQTYIIVPLAGTNLAELTKVGYVWDAKTKTATTTELVAQVNDQSHASLRVWQDGVLVSDVQVHDPSLDPPTSGVQQAGFSLNKLKQCLSDAGIPAWVGVLIGSACGVVCAFTAGAGCIACAVAALGFNSGIVSACIYLAFK